MRALCGAVIAAGSLIGLGLLSIGIGTRYSQFPHRDSAGVIQWVPMKELDSGLLLSLVFLICSALIGLGVAFLGLAYHHHRRYHEHMHLTQPNNTSGARVTV